MCLDKTHWYPKISINPIKVYKCLEKQKNGICTPCFVRYVKEGDIIKADYFWFKTLFTRYVGGEGVHAFKNKPTKNNMDDLLIYGKSRYVAECEIPSFTLYWEGEDNEIAARRIRINKIYPFKSK